MMKSHQYFQSSPLVEQIRGWYLTRATYPNLYVSKKVTRISLMSLRQNHVNLNGKHGLRQKCISLPLTLKSHLQYISAYRRL